MKKTFSMITAFLTAVFIMAGQCQNVAAQAIEPISNNQLLQDKNSCMSTIKILQFSNQCPKNLYLQAGLVHGVQ